MDIKAATAVKRKEHDKRCLQRLLFLSPRYAVSRLIPQKAVGPPPPSTTPIPKPEIEALSNTFGLPNPVKIV